MTATDNSVGLLRRLAIILYDLLLLTAVLMLATALVQSWLQELTPIKLLLFRIYLLLVCFTYFAWQWLRGGQTLPMRTWHVRLQHIDPQKSVTLQQTIIRFTVAILSWAAFGLGFLWALFDKQQRTWHDYASKTHLVYDTTLLY